MLTPKQDKQKGILDNAGTMPSLPQCNARQTPMHDFLQPAVGPA
ncbi:hypothetical protein HCU01_21260 [Halomonas cupida]|uniref:Uncharacterized protein n=1 Tax=Halomonas cupida TaxID=44933 RepID=A0ABQ0WF07_9GAMM|nr:hypothetical protein HCU01_21260 [Halomonas cupida]